MVSFRLRKAIEPVPQKLYWYLLILMAFLPSLCWIGLNRSVFPWDPSWYGEVTAIMRSARDSSLSQWGTAMWDTLPNRSPGTMWVGQFFLPIRVGSSPASGLLLCSLTLQLLSAIALFNTMVRIFHNRLAVFGALLFVVSGPLFVGMTHNYFTEPLQGLGTACVLLFLSIAPELSLWRSAMLLGLALLIAVFGKVSAPIYLAAPALLFAGLALSKILKRERLQFSRRDIPFLLLFITGWAVFGFWLFEHWNGAVAHIRNASSGSASDLYGTRADLITKLGLWIPQLAVAFFHPVLLPVIMVLAILVVAMAVRKRQRWDWTSWVTLASAGQVAFTLILFSLNVNEDPRFLFCLFPFVGILLCWIASQTNRQWLTLLMLTAGLAQFALVYLSAFGVSLRWDRAPYLATIDWKGESLEAIDKTLATTCDEAVGGNRVFVVGLDLPAFNANTLSFYSTLRHLNRERCFYINLGVGESDPDRAWHNLLDRSPAGVVFLTSELASLSAADNLNRVSHAVYEKLRSAPGFRYKRVPEAPDLAVFEGTGSIKWHIRSAMFSDQASVVSDGEGRTNWRVHPSRRTGPATVVDYLDPIPVNAELVGSIRRVDPRCMGLEIAVEVPGASAPQEFVGLTAPLQGREISLRFKNSQPEKIAIKVQSINPPDNIDYCWIELSGVDIRPSASPQGKTGARTTR